jgi:putative salt-induced outer membrane protein YdiY
MSLVRTAGPLALAAFALLAAPRLASAQAAADTAKKSPVKGSIDLGLVASSGNTDLTTFSLGQKLEYLQGKWDVTQGARMVNGQTNGVETANEYAVFVRPGYQISPRWQGYVLGSWDRNPFIGITTRWQEGLGLSFAAAQGPKHTLDLDAGFSYFQQEFTSGESTSFPAARGQVRYRYSFTEKAYLQDVFVYLPNLQDGNDYRMNNEIALVAPVAGRLALKASYLLQYQNAPQPGFERTDNLYTTGLQVTF